MRRNRTPVPVDDETTWLVDEPLDGDRLIRSGLTVFDVVAFHRRPPTPPGVVFESSIPYKRSRRGNRALVVHVYRPAHRPRRLQPTMLFLHGGAWRSGHPFAHIRRAAMLAARGWTTATATYRRTDEATWPAQLEDAQDAIAWLLANSERLGADGYQLSLAGDSAGAQLALMAAVTSTVPIRSLALWCPVVDLERSPSIAADVRLLTGGDPSLVHDANPIEHIGPSTPAVISFAGAGDELVPVSTVRAFHDRLAHSGIRNRLDIHPGGHGFDFDPELWTQTFEDAAAFISAPLPPLP